MHGQHWTGLDRTGTVFCLVFDVIYLGKTRLSVYIVRANECSMHAPRQTRGFVGRSSKDGCQELHLALSRSRAPLLLLLLLLVLVLVLLLLLLLLLHT